MRKRSIAFMFLLLMLTACATTSHVYSEEKVNVILRFEDRISESRQEVILNALGLTVERKLDFIGAIACKGDGRFSLEELLRESKKFPEVRYLEPDYQVQIE